MTSALGRVIAAIPSSAHVERGTQRNVALRIAEKKRQLTLRKRKIQRRAID
jgi:hypothetical protein